MSMTRREFVGAVTLASIGGSTAARALELGAMRTERSSSVWRVGLVQSAPWDVDPARLHEDTSRNLERMLETIAREGWECDWLAFNDCPLTGRAISVVPTSAQIKALQAIAQKHSCALSFGCGADRRAMLIPADGTEVQHGSLVVLNGRRVAIVSTARSDTEITRTMNAGAEALLVMGSGPNMMPTHITDIAAKLRVPQLYVGAACETQIPGHTPDWLGGTLACDAEGLTLGRLAHADETVLQLTLEFRGRV